MSNFMLNDQNIIMPVVDSHYSKLKLNERHRSIKSSKYRLFVQELIQTNEKNITAPYNWPFVRGIYRLPVDSSHKVPVMWEAFHVIRSSESTEIVVWFPYLHLQSLILANSSRRNYSAGDILNLMSVDAGVVAKSTLYWHNIWSSPLTFTGWKRVFHPWHSPQWTLSSQLS